MISKIHNNKRNKLNSYKKNKSKKNLNKLDILKNKRQVYNVIFNNNYLKKRLYKKKLFKYNKLNNFIKQQGYKGYIYINITKNNIIYTLTKIDGSPLISLSPRKLKFKKTGRIDFYLSEIVAKCIAQIAIKLNINPVSIIFNGVGKSRRAAINAFKQKKLKIIQIKDASPIPHNGCRPRKLKRR